MARRIIERENFGFIRLKLILKLGRMDKSEDSTEGFTKHSREEEILRRVNAVLAAVASNVPLSIFSNDYWRIYLKSLDPMHNPPHHLEVTRIVECAIDIAMAEFVSIVSERRAELSHGFVSLSTDFVTDATRREPFGVIIVDLIAECYDLEDGRHLFMSKDTAARCTDMLLSVSLS